MILVIRQEKCGCKVYQDNDASIYITYCPKHKAAPDLYEACKGALNLPGLDTSVRNNIFKVLAKADGK